MISVRDKNLQLPWQDIEADYLSGMKPKAIVKKYSPYGLLPKTLDSPLMST